MSRTGAGRLRRLGVLLVCAVLGTAVIAQAQRGGRGRGGPQVYEPNVPYDGRFT